MSKKKMNGILICRVSSDEQRKEGNSLEAQRMDGEAYLKRLDYNIDKIFTFSESAKGDNPFFKASTERKEFLKAINYAIKNRSDFIAFEKVDRASRNLADVDLLMKLVYQHNIEIHFFRDNQIYTKESKPINWFMLLMNVVNAIYTIMNLSCEVGKGFKAKISQGNFPYSTPYGYEKYKNINGKYNIRPKFPEFQDIERLFKKASEGKSLELISREMEQEGATRKSNKSWLEKIVRDKADKNNPNCSIRYTGHIYNKQNYEIIKLNYEPVISLEEWRKIQKKFRD